MSRRKGIGGRQIKSRVSKLRKLVGEEVTLRILNSGNNHFNENLIYGELKYISSNQFGIQGYFLSGEHLQNLVQIPVKYSTINLNENEIFININNPRYSFPKVGVK